MKLTLLLFLTLLLHSTLLRAQGGNSEKNITFEDYLKDEPQMVIRKLPPAALKVLLMSPSTKIQLLDAREENEYAIAHIERSKAIGFKDFSIQRLWMVDKKACIVVYSANESRAISMAKYLRSVGYLDVQILEGGLINWVNADNSIVDTDNKTTNRLHTNTKENSKLLKRGKAVW